MVTYTDFPSVDSCLRCRGEERCDWHSDVRLSKESVVDKGHEAEHIDADGREDVPRIVADLPPELFYNYNPSGPSPPTFRVLPTPTLNIWEQNIQHRLSLERNPLLKKTFDEMRQSGEIGRTRFPSMDNFRFVNYHVRYVQPQRKPEWRLWRSDTVPRPQECGKAICKMEIYPYSDPCNYM